MRYLSFVAMVLCCGSLLASEGVEAVEATPQNLMRLQREHEQFMGEQQRKLEEFLAKGTAMFGADPRFVEAIKKDSRTPYTGNLWSVDAKQWGVGDSGMPRPMFRALNRVSDKELLAWPSTGDSPVLLRGADTSKVTDKVEFYFPKVVVITGTYSYAAVSGSRNTVLVLDCSESAVKPFLDKVASDQAALIEAEKKRKQAEEEAQYRTWTSAADGRTLEARLVGLANGKAVLQKRDGSQFELAPAKLSKDDQQYIRDEMTRRNKASKPAIQPPGKAPAKAKSRR